MAGSFYRRREFPKPGGLAIPVAIGESIDPWIIEVQNHVTFADLWRFFILISFALHAHAQYQHGTLGVVYFTPNKIVVAADSRLTLPATGGTIDTGCKVVALDNNLIFVSANITTVFSSIFINGWDNNSVLRDVYRKAKSDAGGHSVSLGGVAQEFSESVSAHFNELAIKDSLMYRSMTARLRQGEALTAGYLGGINDSGELALYQVSVRPSFFPPAVGDAQRTDCTAHHNFCAIGDDVWIAIEFADQSSERAKKDATNWKPPKQTTLRTRDAYRTAHIVQLVEKHQTGTGIGGPVDLVELGHNRKLRWFDRKDNCPAN